MILSVIFILFMFPTEILLEIFEAACTDDGTTGRSLSRVSRHFHAASKHLKFQSISLTTPSQLVHFASLLDRTPHSLRRLRYLFVSNIRSVPSSTVLTTTSTHFWESEVGFIPSVTSVMSSNYTR